MSANLLAETSTVVTALYSNFEPQIGSEYRQEFSEAVASSLQHDIAAAWEKLNPILSYCDSQNRPGRKIVSVATEQEYELYLAMRNDGTPTEWIDMVCPGAYKAAAFLYVDAKDSNNALRYLDKASELAPYWAEPLAERGYLLNQLGQHQAALEPYQHALELTDKYQSTAYVKAMALRGIGYPFVEMNDLDKAQKAYEDSLIIEPTNELAKSELAYIVGKRQSK